MTLKPTRQRPVKLQTSVDSLEPCLLKAGTSKVDCSRLPQPKPIKDQLLPWTPGTRAVSELTFGLALMNRAALIRFVLTRAVF